MNIRIVLVVALVIIIIGAAIAFILTQDMDISTTQLPGGGTVTGEVERESSRQQALPTATPIPMIQLVIAVQDIPRGMTIAPDAVDMRPWPEVSAPFQAITSLDEEVIGKIARTDIFREQPILTNMLVDNLSEMANVGSDAAAILPVNRVAVALPIDRLTSVAYAIQPGDRVDVIVSLLFVDVDLGFQSREPNLFNLVSITEDETGEGLQISVDPNAIQGRFDTRPILNAGAWPVLIGPSEQPRPRLAAQRTIQDAMVMYLGDWPRDGRITSETQPPTPTPAPEVDTSGRAGATPAPTPIPPRPDILTLAVSPQDAVVLTWMVEAGLPLTFALRSAAATTLVDTETVTLDYIMNNFSIQVPEKFNYAIEPAIRSIRELSVGNRISLRDSE